MTTPTTYYTIIYKHHNRWYVSRTLTDYQGACSARALAEFGSESKLMTHHKPLSDMIVRYQTRHEAIVDFGRLSGKIRAIWKVEP